MKKVFTSLIAGSCLLASSGVRADLNLSNPYADNGVGGPIGSGNTNSFFKDQCERFVDDFDQRDCVRRRLFPAVETNALNILQIQTEVNANETNNVVKAKTGSTTTAVIGDTTRNILEIGAGTNPTQITQSGINVNGQNLISTDANGITKLGANSLNFQTVNGKENLWGTDANGNIIPLNISNGSKLLINGRDVEQSIDNVGALSAALTGLPTIPLDSKVTCGVGTGAHGGNFAVSGGCATKVSERLTMNFAGSLIPSSQDYQGDGNSWSGRAGFLFKLGKIDKPTQISRIEKTEMKNKIAELSLSNEKIQDQNRQLQAKVDSFEATNRALLSRLEKLEKFASANLDNKDIARK